MKQLVILLLFLGILSCRSFDTLNWGECADSDGAGQDAESTAIMDWSDWPDMIISIDADKCIGSGKAGYKRARLSPGRHAVEYGNYVYKLGHVSGRIELEVKKGHLYEFGFDTCFWCQPRRYAVWVDDRTTGEVVWGKRRDWPSWYL
jgi:hypothetical protein